MNDDAGKLQQREQSLDRQDSGPSTEAMTSFEDKDVPAHARPVAWAMPDQCVDFPGCT